MQPDLIAGRYRVIRAAGRGGMGTVWLCRDELLNREVAVKQIENVPGESAAAAARPLREARLAAAMSHENAVSIYDIVEQDGAPWLVLEYVPSQTLSQVIEQEKRLAVPRVTRIGAQLASALASAHALGITHRDIKPGNVLIGENDLAKITDFGIARGHHDEQLTLTGFMTGTPAYFSPELARGGEASPASDVWALGATLYAAVEGAPPYGKGGNPLALLARIAAEPPPRPTHAGALTGTLASMLDANPRTRASMESVLAEFGRLAGPEDAKVARARERRRAYGDTTLHDRPRGVPAEILVPGASMTPVPAASVPEIGPPPPSEVSRPDDEPPEERGARRPSLALLTVGLALLLVLAIAGALIWTSLSSPTTSDASPPKQPLHHRSTGKSTADSQPTGTGSGQHTGGPRTGAASTPSDSPPTSPSTTPPTSTKTRSTPSQQPPPNNQGAAAFVTSYFQLVPDDTQVGWNELAPSLRARLGRASYESFWGSVSYIEVADVHTAGTHSVEYQITYHYTSGRVDLEHKRIDFVPHGNSFWITADTTLSSVTL